MKKVFLLALTLLVSNIVFSQRASYTEQITFVEPTIDLSQWNSNYQELYKVQESRIANKYTPQLAMIIKNEAEQPEQSDEMINNMLQQNLKGGYSAYFIETAYKLFFSDRAIRMLVRKPKIRQQLFNKGCEILCELVAMYPKDYKQRLIKDIEGWQRDLNEFQMPQGKLIERQGIDEYDGHIHLYNQKGEEIENFWLRRIYFDKIPYEELKSMLNTLLTRVRAVDVTSNDDMMACYKINNEISYCQGTEYCYFLPCNGNPIKRLLHVSMWQTKLLTYRPNDGLYELTIDNNYPLAHSFYGNLGEDDFYCTRVLINKNAEVESIEGKYYPHYTK